MAYSFAERHDRLRTRMRDTNHREVTYRRGKTKVPDIRATVYELKTDELMALGLPLDARRREYIIDVADLAEAGNPFECPRPRDEIIDGDLVLQVTSLGDEACYRYTNHQRKAYRIHTQVIREPNVSV